MQTTATTWACLGPQARRYRASVSCFCTGDSAGSRIAAMHASRAASCAEQASAVRLRACERERATGAGGARLLRCALRVFFLSQVVALQLKLAELARRVAGRLRSAGQLAHRPQRAAGATCSAPSGGAGGRKASREGDATRLRPMMARRNLPPALLAAAGGEA